MMSERLEDIKQTINHPNYTEHNGQEEIYFMVSDNDFNWLIQQAERVQELETTVDFYQNALRDADRRVQELEKDIKEWEIVNESWEEINTQIVEQNKRYREALEEISNADWNSEGLDAERELDKVTDVAIKALEGE